MARPGIGSGTTSPVTVGGHRSGETILADMILDGTTERLAVDAKVSNSVLEANLDKADDEVRAFGWRATSIANGTSSTIATGTSAQILASNTSREAVLITHTSGTGDVFVGLTGCTVTSYIWRIQPGETLLWTQGLSTAAIFAIASAASTVCSVVDISA